MISREVLVHYKGKNIIVNVCCNPSDSIEKLKEFAIRILERREERRQERRNEIAKLVLGIV